MRSTKDRTRKSVSLVALSAERRAATTELPVRARAKNLTAVGLVEVSAEAKHQMVLASGRRAFKKQKLSTNRPALTRAYYEARQLARIAAPDMMRSLIETAKDDEDGRVRTVAALAVLDRAGIRPTDFDPAEGANDGFDFNPRDYTTEELEVLEAALKLMVEKREEKESARALSARFVDPDGAAEA